MRVETKSAEPFQGWFIVELMGHRRLAGWVTEQTIAGAGFLRVDVTGDVGVIATQFFQPSSVYALTPATEAIARQVAMASRVEPVKEWELPQRPAIASTTTQSDRPDDEDHDDRDDMIVDHAGDGGPW